MITDMISQESGPIKTFRFFRSLESIAATLNGSIDRSLCEGRIRVTPPHGRSPKGSISFIPDQQGYDIEKKGGCGGIKLVINYPEGIELLEAYRELQEVKKHSGIEKFLIRGTSWGDWNNFSLIANIFGLSHYNGGWKLEERGEYDGRVMVTVSITTENMPKPESFDSYRVYNGERLELPPIGGIPIFRLAPRVDISKYFSTFNEEDIWQFHALVGRHHKKILAIKDGNDKNVLDSLRERLANCDQESIDQKDVYPLIKENGDPYIGISVPIGIVGYKQIIARYQQRVNLNP